MRPLTFLLLAAALGCLVTAPVGAQDKSTGVARWPQFRGPGGLGVAPDEKKLPIHFGPEKNLVWKSALPPGHSSPCIWNDRIFLTAYDKAAKKLETICLDKKDGKILWRQTCPAEKIEKSHPTGSPAVATPATDGERVYVYFGSCGLLCYDFEGKELWKNLMPVPVTMQGTGTSPIVAGEMVLLHREYLPEPSLMAFNCRTGETVWKQPIQLAKVQGPNNSYSTPVIWRQGGVDEVIIQSPKRITAHDIKDGAERWFINTTSTACTTPVFDKDSLFVVRHWVGTEPGESDPMPSFDELLKRAKKDKADHLKIADFPTDLDLFRRPESKIPGTNLSLKFIVGFIDANKDGQLSREEWEKFVVGSRTFREKMDYGLLAVKPGGKGNVTESHIQWREKRALPEVPSPLFYREHIYLVRDGGILSCLEAKSGKLRYRERLDADGAYFASPVAGDGKIYACSRQGTVVVFAAGKELNILARNDLDELIAATPAAVDGRLYVRTEKHLYAFGE